MNIIKNLRDSLVIVLALILADILSIFNIRLFGITDILWIILVVPILGSLILSLFLHTQKFKFDEWLIYCVGTGLASLMLVGLVINTIGLGTNNATLTRAIILPAVNGVFICMLLLRSRLLLRDPLRKLFPPFLSQKNTTLVIRILFPLILPLLTAFGAIRLNNGAGNGLALIALTLICLYPVILMVFVKKIYREEIVTSLFAIALALALSVSMRSNYLIGFDIHQEFEVFSAALSTSVWQPHLFSNAYNACLSITVLPVTLKALMPISSEYLFKFMMQFLFGIMPIIVFVIANSQLKQKKYAYISALLFIVQGPFIFEFPGLIRQEVGLIFFGLIFASAMSNALSKTAKNVLLIFFGMAMVTSHYSTTYVAIALLLLLVILKPMFTRLRKKLKDFRYSTNQPQQSSWYISPIIVLIILLTAFLWYAETLQTTGGIAQKVTKSVTSFSSILNSDSHSDFITTTLGGGVYTYNSQTLEQAAHDKSVSGGYHPTQDQYTPQPVAPNGVSIDNSVKGAIFNIEHRVVPLFAGAMIAVGLLSMLARALLNRGSLEDGLLATGAGCLFLLLAILPSISQDYNLERLYQQLLVVIAPAFIYGFLVIFKRWLMPKVLTGAMTGVVICYLLGTTGLIDQVVFGISNINLINDGINYDHYYTTNGEVASLAWLQTVPGLTKVNSDRYSNLNAKAYTTIPANKLHDGIFPSEITPNTFVYASDTNIDKGLAFSLYKNHIITFNFPEQYLTSNKGTVYANQDSVIYK